MFRVVNLFVSSATPKVPKDILNSYFSFLHSSNHPLIHPSYMNCVWSTIKLFFICIDFLLISSFMQFAFRIPTLLKCNLSRKTFSTGSNISNLSIHEQISLYKSSFPNMTEAQWMKIEALCNEISKWNEKVNLISRKDIHRLVESHIIPSLSLSLVSNPTTSSSLLDFKKIVDVGTGGGFPGLPLAIACPNTHITLIDSSNKKMKIVAELTETLKLFNTTVICTRAEDFKSNIFGYDFIVGRAVASIPKFLSYSAHLLENTSKSKSGNKQKDLIYESGLLYLKGGEFEGELKDANIQQYSLQPVNQLIPNLITDKKILYIPSKEIRSFHQKLKAQPS